MSRQDRAITERHAKILRELVKQPDNKLCADCKKNDARWASWNIGCFVCIRCSGIHRSMGTHISRVKSVDLDIWQPDQIEHVKKWGNRRANIYWEAHLKPGHVPPEHKIESFIRSKYESRRWAMRSPVPEDPSVLENRAQDQSAHDGAPQPTLTRTAAPPAATSRPTTGSAPPPTRTAHPLLSLSSRTPKAAPAPTARPAAAAATFDLLGDLGDAPQPVATTTTQSGPPPAVPGNRPTAAASNPTSAPTQVPSLAPVVDTSAPTKSAPSAAAGGAGLFDLDFKAPTPTSATQKPKTSTNDILSLFSASSAPPAYTQPATSQHQQNHHQQSHYQPPQQQQAVFGQMGSHNAPPTIAPQGQTAYATWSGSSGVTAPSGGATASSGLTNGMAGLTMGGADVWGASAPVSQSNNQMKARTPSVSSPYSPQPPAQSTSSNAPSTSNHYFSSQDVWGSGGAANAHSNGSAAGGITSPDGFGAFGGAPASGGGANQIKDPFADIWN